MKLLTFMPCVALVVLAGCVARHAPSEPVAHIPDHPDEPTQLAQLLPEGHGIGPSVEVNGTRIVAIVAPGAPRETPYIVLDEALKAGVCTVKETGAVDADGQQVDGDVNTLLVTNTGDKPIFLMAGDLMLGGKQDRVLAESVLVDPASTDMRVPVFCVEQGRWQVQDKDGQSGKQGYFSNTASTGQVDMNVKRAALASPEQGRVWEEVATFTTSLGVGTPTRTFRATYDDEKTGKQIEDTYASAAKLVQRDTVGFAVFHDGELVAMDVFDSTALAGKVSEKLLRSYVMTAIAGGFAEPESAKLARAMRRVNVTLNYDAAPATEVLADLNRALPVPVRLGEGVEAVALTISAQSLRGDQAVLAVASELRCSPFVRGNEIVLLPGTVFFAGEVNEQLPSFYGEPGQQRANVQGQTVAGLQLDTGPASAEPSTAEVNERTLNSREYSPDAFKYDCKDKKTGSKVQTSYMRR